MSRQNGRTRNFLLFWHEKIPIPAVVFVKTTNAYELFGHEKSASR